MLFGYDAILCKEAILMPFAGISYIKFRDGGYRERGLLFANRIVAANKSDRTDAIIGARLSTIINADNGTKIIPEIHGVYTRKLKGQAGKIVAKIDGMNKPFTDIPKIVKTIGNIGASVTAKSGMFEYGVGYDLQLAKKYIGHQGTLKLRISI
ncbi:MAG: autotransporter outer membrane beta-barrel domain-containing protein [Rickettsia endosymbiont of Bryobia graminum]|nr:autotransporter outer membrane beta-barrel domain-containing protein [Rickettsia endosymbiont of Bryobia graminum]